MMERVHILSFEQLLQGFFPDFPIPYAERRRQFHERYRGVLERWKLGAVPKSLRDFRKRHAQFPWDEETLWGEYWDTIKGQLNWRTESVLDREGYIRDATTEFSAEEREAIWEVIATWFEFEGAR